MKKVAILPGDGIGPEIMAEAVKVLAVLDLKFETETALVGGVAFDAHGHPLPESTLNLAKAADAVLFGAVGDWKYDKLERQYRPEQAILAPSFADIFFSNCFKNGLLPIVLPQEQIAKLFDEVNGFVGYSLTIDLPRQVVVKPDGSELPFDVQPFRKYCLVNGFDDIGLTLRHADKIKAFEAERLTRMPWLAQTRGA